MGTTQVVLLSGGLDSTVCAGLARAHGAELIAVSFDYGQRHGIELERAREIARHYHAEHIEVRLDASRWGGSALTDASVEVPAQGTVSEAVIPVTYVPARNTIFLSVALAIAEARAASAVVIGVNALDYSGYPDCRPEFINAFREVARLGTREGAEGRPIEVLTPLIAMTKAEIVATGRRIGAPLELTWSCYAGGPDPCGECEACVLRRRGYEKAAQTGAPV